MTADDSSEESEVQELDDQGLDPGYDVDSGTENPSLSGVNDPHQSGWLSCLASIHDRFLTGYHRETFKRLGGGKFAGLHSEFEVSISRYVTSIITLRLWIRDHDCQHFLMSIILPLDRIEGSISVVDRDPDNMDVAIADSLINHAVRPLRELRNGTGATQDSWSEALERPNDDEDFVEEEYPGTFIQRATSKFRHLSLNIQTEKIKFIHSNRFKRLGSAFPDEVMELRQAVLAGMRTWTGTIRFDLCFQAEAMFAEQWMPKLDQLQLWSSPYQLLREYTESPHLRSDKSFIYGFNRPDCAVPASTVFMSDLQRTTSLITGTVEEANFLWEKADRLCSMRLDVVVVRDPYTLWEPTDDDLQKYGIVADRVPLHQYFVLSSKDVSNLLPKVGERCRFRLCQSCEQREIPESGWGFDDFIRIARELRDNIHRAWHNSNSQGRLGPEPPGNAQVEAFTASVLGLILPMLETPDNEPATAYPFTSLAVHRLRIAARWAEQIVAAFTTHWGFNRYLFEWVQEHVKRDAARDNRDPMWTARRIPLPQGTQADIAIFSVRTPLEVGWPSRFHQPPLNPRFPAIHAVGNLNQFLQGVSEQLAMGDPDLPCMEMQLLWSPEEKLAQAEIEAVNEMKDLQRFPQIRDFWEYTLDFQQVPAPEPFLVMFPHLDMVLNTDRFSQEHIHALRNLTYEGCSFMEARPGQGKLTMLAAICRSITEADGRIALIAPTDDMVQDLYDYMVGATSEMTKVVRMMPWKAEKHNLTALPSEPRLIDTNSNVGTTADVILAEHLNSFTKARHDKSQPSRIVGSASNITLQLMAQRNPSAINLMRGGGNEETEITSSHMRRRRRRAGLELSRTVTASDIVCATPLAFAQMMDHMGNMHFSLIVIDGAEGMTEATSLIPLSKCPSARHLFIGDSQQPGPVCLARDDDEFLDVFGPQRQMSLFRRAYEAGVVTASLSRVPAVEGSEDYGTWDCISRNASDDNVGFTSSVCDTESTDLDDRRIAPFPEHTW